MSTVVFNTYWPECRMKFCFSLISPDKWSSGGRKKNQPDLHLHRILLYHTGTCMRPTAQSWEHSSHSPHCMARAHLQPQRGTRDPAPLAPLPNPYLAWDRAGRISRKGKEQPVHSAPRQWHYFSHAGSRAEQQVDSVPRQWQEKRGQQERNREGGWATTGWETGHNQDGGVGLGRLRECCIGIGNI